MTDGIIVRFLGDFGPFSRMGKSIGYLITISNTSFLLDCGAPLFQQIGGDGLKNIQRVIITHCHDDHKRWFTDLSLFNRYTSGRKTLLMTSEDVHDELIRASLPSLDRSLSEDAETVIDVSWEDFIDYRMLGPKALYRIAKIDEGKGRYQLAVVDAGGNPLGPEKAKVVVSRKTGRLRMLFRDEVSGDWVEPEHFYPFSSAAFYEEQQNIYADPEGFVIEPVKAPVWHGISSLGIRIRTQKETLTFSSDTHHDKRLWKSLSEKKRQQHLSMSRREFDAVGVIHGDINDYIQRIWSEERYLEAVRSFEEGIVIHDISAQNSVVHTDYENLVNTTLSKARVILTHSPDKITSTWALGDTEKIFRIMGSDFFEAVGNRLFKMDADIYHKEAGRYFAGYRNGNGLHQVYEKSGLLGIAYGELPEGAKELFRVDLYEDIGGQYYPVLDNMKRYRTRPDGQMERVIYSPEGSTGEIVRSRMRNAIDAEGADFSG
jgi:ribonuclease BN (tRNA processing enzyme)